MMRDEFHLLDPHFLNQARALRIVARRVAPDGRWAEHRSSDRGSGLDFRDYRPYSPGDDLRSIDWNIHQRLKRIVIRLFDQMEDLPVYLLPDLSFSMWQETAPRAVAGLQVTIGLSSVALDQHDRVGIFPFGNELDSSFRPTSGRGRLSLLAAGLTRAGVAARKARTTTDLAASVSRFRSLGLRQGLIVIISDFLDPNGADSILDELKKCRDRILLVGLRRDIDRDPLIRGDVRVRDCETGVARDITIDERMLKRYRRAYDSHFGKLQEFCKKRQGAFLGIDVEQDVLTQLAQLFEAGRYVA